MADQGKNWLEWLVLVAGGALVLACAGVLVYEMARSDAIPPRIQVELGQPEPRAGRYALPVTVRNAGDVTAEDLRVRVTLEGEGEAEHGLVHLSYLTGHGSKRGWVMFAHDPAAGRLRWSVVGFREP